jgi:IS30 family transposase
MQIERAGRANFARIVPGHGEGDLLLGRHGTQRATVVERTTGFTVWVPRPGRDRHAVTAGLSRERCRLSEQVRRSLTWDRGMALANH